MKERITPLITEQEINKKLTELSERISKDYEGKNLYVACLLKGAVIFMVDLARKITVPVQFGFMDVSSYGGGTESSGIIKINMDLEETVMGKHVLLVEDIVDSGRTLSCVINHLKSQNPADIKICTLLDKPSRRVVSDFDVHYTGFTIPDEFVVGYGLDYDQRYRNLPFIGMLSFEQE